MATTKVRTKNTALQQYIGGATNSYVTVAQVISLNIGSFDAETFEADTLDNASAWIPYHGTGRTETGSISGELFFDPGSTDNHHYLLNLLNNPPAIGSEEQWKIVFADTGNTEWTFTGAGLTLDIVSQLNNGLVANFSIKIANVASIPDTDEA